MPAPANQRMLSAPFVAQLAYRAGAVLAPQPSTTPGQGYQRLLANGSTVRLDGYQGSDWPAMPRDDCRLALLGRLEQFRQLIAGLFSPLTSHRTHGKTVRSRTVPVNRNC